MFLGKVLVLIVHCRGDVGGVREIETYKLAVCRNDVMCDFVVS